MSDRIEARTRLAESLRRRVPTWAVARDILALEVAEPGTKLARELKELAAAPSWYDEIYDDFDRVDPADTQLKTFSELFPTVEALVGGQPVAPDDPDALRALALEGRKTLGAGNYPSAGEALADFRLLARALPEGVSRKGLRKRLRFLRDFEGKTSRVADVLRLRRAQMQAKSRLAYEVDPAQCNDRTLAFCAYLAARANRRSIFMIGEQSRAFDTIVDELEKLIWSDPDTNWAQVALVKPTKQVITKLPPAARGALIGRFHAALADSAQALEGLYGHLPERMRAEMVMVKGVDSSRWNAYAGALNTMRSAWISSVLAAGLDEILDSYCPGKAPRLMASDLVWWYRSEGKELHEDTRMFSALPHPWDVVQGRAPLTREQALAAAERLGVNAEETGWVGPRAAQERERPEAEPALVHGVVVSDPQLAATLKRCGVFSAKQLKHVEELPMLLARDMKIDDKGQMTPTIVGAVDAPPLSAFLSVEEPELDLDQDIGAELGL